MDNRVRDLLRKGPMSRERAAGREARLLRAEREVRRLSRRVDELEATLEGGGQTSPDGLTGDPRARFFAGAAGHTPILAADLGDRTFLVSSEDQGVGRSLFVDRAREETHTLLTALDLIERHTKVEAGPGIFVDVGANIGTTTVAALLDGGFESAIACEPDPRNLQLLEANLALNGLACRVQVEKAAVSDAAGQARLARSPRNQGDHRLVDLASPAGAKLERRESIEVQTTTLDRLIEQAGSEVGLIWIDTQGHEPAVFRGGAAAIGAGIPVVFELWPKALEPAGGFGALVAALPPGEGRVFDLRSSPPAGSESPRDQALAAIYEACAERRGVTDVLLLLNPR